MGKTYKDYLNEMYDWSTPKLKKTAKTGIGQQAVAAQDLLDYEKEGCEITKEAKPSKKKLVDLSGFKIK
ncbi:MAG: hypothetical protein V5A64_07145 [Candidatus Thermoplasmatota archaeon]